MATEWQRWRQTHPLGPLLPLAYTLIFKMLLPSGISWMWMLLRLIVFAICLIPAWISIGWFYFRSENIKRNVCYGPNARNYLDIYYPNQVLAGKKAPVLIFITGGAWIIGYKAWGCLFSKILMNQGILCVNADYRNFPQGRVLDMIEDTSQVIEWTINNIGNYGGDSNRIYVAGQSAGAHLGLISILFRGNNKKINEKITWKAKDIKGFIGISGPYDIQAMKEHFHKRGLHRDVYSEIFKMKRQIFCDSSVDDEKQLNIDYISPTQYVKQHCNSDTQLPHLYFFHGTKDDSCPHSSTEEFVNAVSMANIYVNIKTKYYEGKSHTDPILEDLMHDDTVHEGDLMHDICKIVHKNSMKSYVSFSNGSPKRRNPNFLELSADPYNPTSETTSQTIVHRYLLSLARKINPF